MGRALLALRPVAREDPTRREEPTRRGDPAQREDPARRHHNGRIGRMDPLRLPCLGCLGLLDRLHPQLCLPLHVSLVSLFSFVLLICLIVSLAIAHWNKPSFPTTIPTQPAPVQPYYWCQERRLARKFECSEAVVEFQRALWHQIECTPIDRPLRVVYSHHNYQLLHTNWLWWRSFQFPTPLTRFSLEDPYHTPLGPPASLSHDPAWKPQLFSFFRMHCAYIISKPSDPSLSDLSIDDRFMDFAQEIDLLFHPFLDLFQRLHIDSHVDLTGVLIPTLPEGDLVYEAQELRDNHGSREAILDLFGRLKARRGWAIMVYRLLADMIASECRVPPPHFGVDPDGVGTIFIGKHKYADMMSRHGCPVYVVSVEHSHESLTSEPGAHFEDEGTLYGYWDRYPETVLWFQFTDLSDTPTQPKQLAYRQGVSADVAAREFLHRIPYSKVTTVSRSWLRHLQEIEGWGYIPNSVADLSNEDVEMDLPDPVSENRYRSEDPSGARRMTVAAAMLGGVLARRSIDYALEDQSGDAQYFRSHWDPFLRQAWGRIREALRIRSSTLEETWAELGPFPGEYIVLFYRAGLTLSLSLTWERI